MTGHASLADRAATELRGAASGVDPAALAALVEDLAQARRIVSCGVGREGPMMRALAMRLYHLGLDAHVVGDMSCPPAGPGDLPVVSAGPGDFSTVAGLTGVAKAAGARTACVTAQPAAPMPRACDRVPVIPAQTMADDQTPAPASVLPMGSLFEGARFPVFEIQILILRDRIGTSPDAMRARHTNLEQAMSDRTERFSLQGRKALVTGASKGIGAEICAVFADAGTDIVAVARDAEGLADGAIKMTKGGSSSV